MTAGDVNEAVQGLIVNGIFEGVGSVLSFLPVIVTMFFFLSLLEVKMKIKTLQEPDHDRSDQDHGKGSLQKIFRLLPQKLQHTRCPVSGTVR